MAGSSAITVDAGLLPEGRVRRIPASFLFQAIALSLAIITFLPGSTCARTLGIEINPAASDQTTPLRPGRNTTSIRSFDELQHALDTIAANADTNSSIVVTVAPGTYRITAPLELNAERLHGAALEIRGSSADSTRVLGSIQVSGTDRIALTDQALSKYRTYRYGLAQPTTPHPILIWANGERIVPGRWPARGWGYIQSVTDDGTNWRFKLATGDGQPADLMMGDVRLSGFPSIDWSYESSPARVVAPDEIEIAKAAVRYKPKAKSRITLENARGRNVDSRAQVAGGFLDLRLDEPAELAKADSFAHIRKASGITISGISFEGFGGDAITIDDSQGIVVQNNRFERVGGRAVYADKGKNIEFTDNAVRFMGEGGVDVDGGDRVSLARSDILISRNTFERFAEIAWTYRPAVYVRGVGATVSENTIRNAPHVAIIFEGNDHRISGNTISSVDLEVSDSGAIYGWRDWTTYGTVIEDNLLFDITSRKDLNSNGSPPATDAVKGIYLDDFASGIKIQNNIFYNVDYAVFINGGSDVEVNSNIFIRCTPPLLFYAWGLAHPRSSFSENHRAIAILRDLTAKGSLLMQRHPRLRESVESLLVPAGDKWSGNVLIGSPEPEVFNKKVSSGYMDLSGARTLPAAAAATIPNPRLLQNPRAEIRARVEALLSR